MKLFLFLISCATLTFADYWADRARLIKEDQHKTLGSTIILSAKEKQVNKILMSYKLSDFDQGFLKPGEFLPSQHFFKSKAAIEETNVFKIIQKLPKGASLHSHDTALVSQEFLFNLTYTENLYGCVLDDNTVKLHFAKNSLISNECEWQLLSEIRKTDANFDILLKSQLTLIVDDPEIEYLNINKVWKVFTKIFIIVEPLISYKPVFQEYFYQALLELYEDNVMHMEFRGYLPDVYDLDGRIYKNVEVAGLYYETLQKFKVDYPLFHGAKFIYAPSRRVSNATFDSYMSILADLQEKYPTFIAGFDLVGQEDLGEPLANFIPSLLQIQNITKFFFHAGETNWIGETDFNLFDAILLNTTRIGHGYAILKHPSIENIVMEKQIALEISPISNQVLKLVDDLRNHPAATLIANGFPVVITCDDPSFWGAKGLSYDWYMAFMGMSSRESDLRLLKQLALNSLLYSVIDDKEDALNNWNIQWEKFLDEIISGIPVFCVDCLTNVISKN